MCQLTAKTSKNLQNHKRTIFNTCPRADRSSFSLDKKVARKELGKTNFTKHHFINPLSIFIHTSGRKRKLLSESRMKRDDEGLMYSPEFTTLFDIKNFDDDGDYIVIDYSHSHRVENQKLHNLELRLDRGLNRYFECNLVTIEQSTTKTSSQSSVNQNIGIRPILKKNFANTQHKRVRFADSETAVNLYKDLLSLRQHNSFDINTGGLKDLLPPSWNFNRSKPTHYYEPKVIATSRKGLTEMYLCPLCPHLEMIHQLCYYNHIREVHAIDMLTDFAPIPIYTYVEAQDADTKQVEKLEYLSCPMDKCHHKHVVKSGEKFDFKDLFEHIFQPHPPKPKKKRSNKKKTWKNFYRKESGAN